MILVAHYPGILREERGKREKRGGEVEVEVRGEEGKIATFDSK